MSALVPSLDVVETPKNKPDSASLTPAEFRQKLTARLGQLDSDRQRFRPHYRELQRWILPDNGLGISGPTQDEQKSGSKVRQFIIDSTASLALRTMAAGMQSGLTSPSRPWFKLGLDDPDLTDFLPVKMWLADAESRMYKVFNRSNFYNCSHKGYAELGGFATWANYIGEDFDNIIHCRSFTCGEFWLGLNDKLQVDTFFHRAWKNAAQIVEEYGIENVSSTVKNLYEGNNLKMLLEVIQAIEPNDDRYKVTGAKGKAWRSATFERGGESDKVLKVRGYEEFPVQAPRWMTVGGEVYGKESPGMIALGDVKMLQKMVEKQLVNLDKMLDPPVVMPSGMKLDNVNSMPGGITYDDSPAGNNGARPLYQVPMALEAAEKLNMSVRQRIDTAFFKDLFLMLAQEPTRSNVTATEIAERQQEKMTVLGPVIENIETEFLDPAIDRTFAIMMRNGALPPPPREIQGKTLRVEYISVLAQASKLVQVPALANVAEFVSQLAAIVPQATDVLNWDEVIQEYAEFSGVSPKAVNAPEVIAANRQARAKQQKQQQAIQAAEQLSKSAKNLSGADLSGNNVLGAITGQTASPAATG